MMAHQEQHHATCVSIGDAGVLLCGPSGAGKSDIALQLLDQGAELVADDRTDIRADSGVLTASAPANIAGMMEIRGVGIVRRPYRAEVVLGLVVELTPNESAERLPSQRKKTFMGVLLPHMTASGRSASTPAKIRLALSLASDDLIEPK